MAIGRGPLDVSVQDVIESLRQSSTPAFVTHRHADKDAIGSAVGLQRVVGRGTVCTPAGVTKSAQRVLTATETSPATEVARDTHDLTVVLDAPSSDRIAPIEPHAPVVIDHHEPDDLKEQARAAVLDQSAGATAELVVRLAREGGWTVPAEAALALLVGIYDDTEMLQTASPETMGAVQFLLNRLEDQMAEFPELVREPEPSKGEQIARSVATLRATGYRSGETFLAVTRVGAHETAACQSLRDAGLDVVAVASSQDPGVRVTVRASGAVSQLVSVGGDLLPALITEHGGDGGGHEGAGTANLEVSDHTVIETSLVEALESKLEVTFTRV